MILIALIVSFLIGSIPTAYLMGRLKGIDIRAHGSGNVGATNVFRVLGKFWGLACLALDIFKGWLPVMLFSSPRILGHVPAEGWLWALGVAAIAGHMFSPFLNFKGGKGVATSLGVVLAIAPLPMLLVFILGVAIILSTGYVSVASITGSALLPFLILVIYWARRPWVSFFVTLALGALIIWKHRANIARLRSGTEKRILRKPENGHGNAPGGSERG